MKNFLALLLLSISVVKAYAQNEEKQYKHWNKGALNWDDFQASPLQNSTENSYLSFYLSYNTAKEKIDGAKATHLKAYAFIHRSSSWVKQANKNPAELLYNQVIFNLLELHRRELQKELNQLRKTIYSQAKLNAAMQKAVIEINLFKTESDYGKNESIVEKWASNVEGLLIAVPPYKLPDYRLSKIGYGASLGMGYTSLTGSLGRHFTNPINLSFGFDFTYKKSFLFLEASTGFNKVSEEFYEGGIWEKGLTTGLSLANVSYGYIAAEGTKFRIVPFIGIGNQSINYRGQDEQFSKYGFGKVVLLGGINFDYILNTHMVFTSPAVWGAIREKNQTILRSKIYVTKADYRTDLRGYSINLGLTLEFYGRLIKLK